MLGTILHVNPTALEEPVTIRCCIPRAAGNTRATKTGIFPGAKSLFQLSRGVTESLETNYNDVEKKLKDLSVDVIEQEFKRTPEGEALLHLDEVHQEVQDYIWSAGSETEQLFKTIGHVLKHKANIQLGYNKIALPNK